MTLLKAPMMQKSASGLAVFGTSSNVYNPWLDTPRKGYGGQVSQEGYSAVRVAATLNDPKTGYATGRTVPIVADRKTEETGPEKSC